MNMMNVYACQSAPVAIRRVAVLPAPSCYGIRSCIKPKLHGFDDLHLVRTVGQGNTWREQYNLSMRSLAQQLHSVSEVLGCNEHGLRFEVVYIRAMEVPRHPARSSKAKAVL